MKHPKRCFWKKKEQETDFFFWKKGDEKDKTNERQHHKDESCEDFHKHSESESENQKRIEKKKRKRMKHESVWSKKKNTCNKTNIECFRNKRKK